ncbi:MAG: ATP-binding cassette domain-containing protein [Cellulosilyticaceae bacterium]
MIQVEDLRFCYKGMKEDTLKGISFKVEKTECFGLLGPSGAGKSTLQKVLLGLEKKYRGKAVVMGTEVSGLGNKYYDRIGVGFELPNLYEQLTVWENLETFRGLYKTPADSGMLLRQMGLYEHKDKKVNQISKGMKMRLNFCRALIGTPDILFLDEPTSGLDPNNTAVIREAIRNYKAEGKTVILTTHNMSFAEQICDCVAFIVEGEIKEMGTPEALREKYGVAQVVVETEKGEETFALSTIGKDAGFRVVLDEGNITRIDTKKPSLEEIFTTVTGRVLI